VISWNALSVWRFGRGHEWQIGQKVSANLLWWSDIESEFVGAGKST